MTACRVVLVDQGLSRSRAWSLGLEMRGHSLTRVSSLKEYESMALGCDLLILHEGSLKDELSVALLSQTEKEEAPEVLVVLDVPDASRAVACMKHGAADCLMGDVSAEQVVLFAESRAKASAQGCGRLAGKTRIVTQNPRMEGLLSMLDRVADSSASVLISGESGTGKELIARYVHGQSRRRI